MTHTDNIDVAFTLRARIIRHPRLVAAVIAASALLTGYLFATGHWLLALLV